MRGDIARGVLGSLLLGCKGSLVVEPSDLHTNAQRRILGALATDDASLPLVYSRLAGDDEAQAEVALCLPAGEAVLSPGQFDALVRELRRENRAALLRSGAAALATGGRFAPGDPEIQAAVARLAELARPEQGGRAPLHVSHGLERIFTQGRLTPVPLGVAALERMEVVAGDLCIIGARPGVGKTAMLGTIALACAGSGWDVLFLTLEMPTLQIQQRLLAGFGRIPLGVVRAAEDTALIRHATELGKLSLWVEDGDSEPRLDLTLEGIDALVRLFCATGGDRPRVVLVDYLQFVRTTRTFERRHEGVGHTVRELKRLAKEARVPLIVAAQVGRKVEDRGKEARPQMADLAESGDIEKNADEIVFLHRNPDAPSDAEFKVAKNRNGESGWKGRMEYAGQWCLFVDAVGGGGWE